jgi:hypothetical protein
VGGALGGRPLDHLDGGQKARIKAGEDGSGISHGAHLIPMRQAGGGAGALLGTLAGALTSTLTTTLPCFHAIGGTAVAGLRCTFGVEPAFTIHDREVPRT